MAGFLLREQSGEHSSQKNKEGRVLIVFIEYQSYDPDGSLRNWLH